MKKFDSDSEKTVQEICHLFDEPWHARMIMNEALDKGNDRVRSSFSLGLLLQTQKELRAIRDREHQKSPVSILRFALDMLPDTREGGVGSSYSGFNFLQWQEGSWDWRS